MNLVEAANAGSMPITLRAGALVFDLATSFCIIRAGHIFDRAQPDWLFLTYLMDSL